MKSLQRAVDELAEIGRVPDADDAYDSSRIMQHFARLGIQAQFCHSNKCLIAEYLTRDMQVPEHLIISVGTSSIGLMEKSVATSFRNAHVSTPPVLAEVINLFDNGLAPICLYDDYSLEQMTAPNRPLDW